MDYIEATNSFKDSKRPFIFMAGGITDCSDWQTDLSVLLLERCTFYPHGNQFYNTYHKLAHIGTILNPRRANFPIGDPDAARNQIDWEYDALNASDIISFWFSPETLNPIVLYELGAYRSHPHICVGIHPEYKRKQDVEIQLGLHRPNIEIVYSISDLAYKIIDRAELLIAAGTY